MDTIIRTVPGSPSDPHYSEDPPTIVHIIMAPDILLLSYIFIRQYAEPADSKFRRRGGPWKAEHVSKDQATQWKGLVAYRVHSRERHPVYAA